MSFEAIIIILVGVLVVVALTKRDRERAARLPDPDARVFVKRYRGDKELAEGIEKMLDLGWQVQSQSTRKEAWNPMTGVFTSNQIHTVTYVRNGEPSKEQEVDT